MTQLGHRTGILDLTQGEMGTRGTAEERKQEADAAARILRASWRKALDIPDGRVENTWENRLKVAQVIRELQPRVVILPYWQGRHPDHYTTATLGYEACFLAGLAKLDTSGRAPSVDRPAELHAALAADDPKPHRPFKIIYATLYYDIRPTFVVDITDQFDARSQALMAYKSQFSDQEVGKDIFPAQAEIRARMEALARYYGMLGGVTYAEPFLQKEVGLVEDLALLPVKSI
jgi:bacillithiol biosynthesis deacetylase BshB1